MEKMQNMPPINFICSRAYSHQCSMFGYTCPMKIFPIICAAILLMRPPLCPAKMAQYNFEGSCEKSYWKHHKGFLSNAPLEASEKLL